jgi:predicted  nucleic acid-binding Zn-ribbon protein
MSNDKIDQLKQFAAKDLEQTKADFQQAKDKVSELGSDIKQKGQETVEDVKTLQRKILIKLKLIYSKLKIKPMS